MLELKLFNDSKSGPKQISSSLACFIIQYTMIYLDDRVNEKHTLYILSNTKTVGSYIIIVPFLRVTKSNSWYLCDRVHIMFNFHEGLCLVWTLSWLSDTPTGTRRNNNVIMTSTRRRDVVLTL